MPPIRRHILIPRLRRSEMLEPSTPLRDITVLADGAVNAAASMINEAYEPDVDWTGDMMNVSGSFVVTDPDKSQPALYVVTEPRNENMGKLQEDSNARALRSLQNQFDDFRTRSDRKISKLKSKVDRSDRKISELKSKVDRSDRKISDLERKAARLDHENIRLCAELSASGRKITSLQDEVQDLKLVTSSLMPVQRRKLLEFAKEKVKELTHKVLKRNMPQVVLHNICKELRRKRPEYPLSEDALKFLADKRNTIHQDGNAAAPNAIVSDIRMALTTDPHFADAYTKGLLQNLFEFVYEQPLHQHVAN